MRGRKDFLARAIDCFRRQTYERRELLIVADSFGEVDCLPHDIASDICASALIPTTSMNVGQKRNRGCEDAHGDLIAIWDDDDYSAPGRLRQQANELAITGKSVTGYNMMKFTDGSAWWSFKAGAGLVLGTSLMFRREWWEKHPFPEVQIGEEGEFCSVPHEANQLAEVPDLSLMYATIHEGNTSKRRPGQDAGWVPLPGFQWPTRSE